MTTTPALAPYPYFTDSVGTALDGGKIYIGTADLDPRTNPITVYQDAANTITWAQPLRTVSGYPAYQGAPSNFYPTAITYSIVVTTSTGAVVFRNLNVATGDTQLRADLAASTGASLVGFSHANTYAPGTLGAKGKQFISVKDAPYNAVGDGVADDTAAIQAANDYCATNRLDLDVSGGPYKITSLNVTCRMFGSRYDRFGTSPTFTSAVGAGVYAVRLLNTTGSLERVTVVNTGAGNGIDCNLASTQMALHEVAVVTTYALATGSGSIGVQYGTAATPGQQIINATVDEVSVRGYDISHNFGYYANANTYRRLSAFNTTTNPATKSTHGFKINCRGGVFEMLHCESNFLNSMETLSTSEENLIDGFWTEGTAEQSITLNGNGNVLRSPYGDVGGPTSLISLTVGADCRVEKTRTNTYTAGDFAKHSRNLLRNALFSQTTGGLGWPATVALSGSAINGYNSVTIADPATAGSITVDHALTYIDLDLHPWLRGKTVVYSAFGIAESGVSMSIRGIVRNAASSNLQYGTSINFPTGSADVRFVRIKIPTLAADAKYLVFRVQASGVPTGGAGKAGEIACPMVYLGKDLVEIAPRSASDGENTFYGDQLLRTDGTTAAGTAMMQLGNNWLWVDPASGKLRIKSGTRPTNIASDGVVVGTQT